MGTSRRNPSTRRYTPRKERPEDRQSILFDALDDDDDDEDSPDRQEYEKLLEKEAAANGQVSMVPYYSGPRPASGSARAVFDAVLKKQQSKATFTREDANRLEKLRKKFGETKPKYTGTTNMVPYYSGPKPARAAARLASDVVRRNASRKAAAEAAENAAEEPPRNEKKPSGKPKVVTPVVRAEGPAEPPADELIDGVPVEVPAVYEQQLNSPLEAPEEPAAAPKPRRPAWAEKARADLGFDPTGPTSDMDKRIASFVRDKLMPQVLPGDSENWGSDVGGAVWGILARLDSDRLAREGIDVNALNDWLGRFNEAENAFSQWKKTGTVTGIYGG